MITHKDIFLDFETRSRAKLSDVGAWRYAEDPSTRVLCLSYAFGNREPYIWVEGQQPPKKLLEKIREGYRIHGWNSTSFERAIFEVICGPKMGWDTPSIEQYRDTMTDALELALPAKLEKCAEVMGCVEKKDVEGHKIMMKLCKPIASGKLKGQFREREDHMPDYIKLYAYCKQDVRTERDVYKRLPYHVEGESLELMRMTMRINERGLPVDMPAVEAINDQVEKEKIICSNRFYDITGIESPTQREVFQNWVNENGPPLPNCQAETVFEYLQRVDLHPKLREAIELRNEVTTTSNAKYAKLIEMVCKDGTVKNNLIYRKAGTGRFAGAGFQGQNLPALSLESPNSFIEFFLDYETDFIRLFYGIFKAASGLIRRMIKAPDGYKFLSGDLKGIEARFTAWGAKEYKMLDNFRKGIDAYVSSAAEMYNVTTDVVMQDYRNHGEMRPAGKIAVLSGGFGGGFRALLKMAIKMHMEMDEATAKRINRQFRKARPKLVNTWTEFGEAAIAATENAGFTIQCGNKCAFRREKDFLFMILPSGRKLSFPFPRVEEELFYGRMQKNVTAMWTDSKTKQWVRRTITGANFFQSYVQAGSCDVLTDGHLRVEAEEDMPLILSVHDEGLSMVPDEPRYTTAMYGKLMSQSPVWGPDLPIESDCWEGHRFRK